MLVIVEFNFGFVIIFVYLVCFSRVMYVFVGNFVDRNSIENFMCDSVRIEMM